MTASTGCRVTPGWELARLRLNTDLIGLFELWVLHGAQTSPEWLRFGREITAILKIVPLVFIGGSRSSKQGGPRWLVNEVPS